MPPPKRPLSGYFLFVGDKRKDKGFGKGLKASEFTKAAGELWRNLSDEDKIPYTERAAALKEQYKKDMEEYNKENKANTVKSVNKESDAAPMATAPKRPMSGYFLFLADKRKDEGFSKGLKASEFTKAAGELWKNLSDEVKTPYTDKAAALKEQYQKDMEEYNNEKAAGAVDAPVAESAASRKKKRKADMASFEWPAFSISTEPVLPLTTVKRVMKLDTSSKQTSSVGPLVSKATEFFIHELAQKACKYVLAKNQTQMKLPNLYQAVQDDRTTMEFFTGSFSKQMSEFFGAQGSAKRTKTSNATMKKEKYEDVSTGTKNIASFFGTSNSSGSGRKADTSKRGGKAGKRKEKKEKRAAHVKAETKQEKNIVDGGDKQSEKDDIVAGVKDEDDDGNDSDW